MATAVEGASLCPGRTQAHGCCGKKSFNAQERQQFEQTEAWYRRALGIAAEYNMHAARQILAHLGALQDELGADAFAAAWAQAFPGQPPPV